MTHPRAFAPNSVPARNAKHPCARPVLHRNHARKARQLRKDLGFPPVREAIPCDSGIPSVRVGFPCSAAPTPPSRTCEHHGACKAPAQVSTRMNIVHMIVRCVQHVGLSDRIILTSPGPLMLEIAYTLSSLARVPKSVSLSHELPRTRRKCKSHSACTSSSDSSSSSPSSFFLFIVTVGWWRCVGGRQR